MFFLANAVSVVVDHLAEQSFKSRELQGHYRKTNKWTKSAATEPSIPSSCWS